MNCVFKSMYSAGIALACMIPAGFLCSCSDDDNEVPAPVITEPSTSVVMNKPWECYYFLPYKKNYGNYYMEFATGEVGTDGFYTYPLNPGDYILCLDMNASLDADHNNPTLPEGVYTATESPEEENNFTFTLSNTMALYNVEIVESGQARSKYIRPSDGTIKVEHTDNGYRLTCDFVESTTGESWRFTYEGEIPLVDMSGIEDDDSWGFAGDVKFDAVKANYNFYDDSETNGTDNYIMRFFDITNVSVDGAHPMDVGHKIQLNLRTVHGAGIAGTYTIGKSTEAGYCYSGERWGAIASGSFVEKVRADLEVRYALLSEGTVTIADKGNGTYAVKVDAINQNGEKIIMSYKGEIEDLTGQKPVYSTLNSDVEMSISRYGDAFYYGDYYQNNTTNYIVTLLSESEYQMLALDIVGAAGGSATELPTGTFTVSDEYNEGTLSEGIFESTGISHTAFVQYDATGEYAERYAPISGGSLTITKSDSQYTFTFDLTDDARPAHHITGTFTTPITIKDYAQAFSAKNLMRKIGSKPAKPVLRFKK